MTTSYDAIIIGTGQAGPSLAARLANAGMKVAIIERKSFGGTCVNTGCIPTKTLVASAEAAYVARRGADFGITVPGDIRVDMKKVKARKDAVSAQSRTGVETWLKTMERCTVYEGHARLESSRQVRVADDLFSADRIFINTGGRALVPDMPGLDSVGYLTNSSMMDVDLLPRHLAIVGGSYVSLEFAQMYRRFGSEVTVIEKGPRLAGREDQDISDAIKDILIAEGVNVRLGAECMSVAHDKGDVLVRVSCNNGAPEVRASHLLLAVGRRPNTDDLGLERAGVEVDQRGYITVDDQLRTNVPGIWALGDCNGRGAFTHTSYNDFEIVAANLLDGQSRSVSDRIPAYAMYIDPPLGRAGLTEAEIRSRGIPALMAKRPMTRVARAVEKGRAQGFMKVLVHAETKRILGAALLGIGGDEAIHEILDVMYAGVPYTVLQRAMHIHPTVSELIPTMLGELAPLPAKVVS
ncbi:MAG TPA: FAD-containing oxidoreductase [Spirochaetia bacterium]|nr:FAD-containing oxidoreductase [Spirochaetia bacterium]